MPKLVRHITLRQLQVFEAVARLRNFSRAGEELFLTQSTVSTQIKNLSDAVQYPLVEQIGKEVHLTEAGTLLHKAGKDILHILENTDMALANLKELKQGKLRLASVTTAKHFVPEVLGRFSQLYPEIEMSLTIQNRKTILQRLNNQADDLYILGHHPLPAMDIHTQALAPNPLYVVASAKHPITKHRTRLTLKELAEQTLILREPGSEIRSAVESLFEIHGLKLNPRMVFDSNEAIKQAVVSRLGVSILSLHSILPEDDNSRIAIVDTDHFPLKSNWHIAYPKDKELSVVAKAFLEHLSEEGQRLSHQLDNLSKKLHRQAKKPVLEAI